MISATDLVIRRLILLLALLVFAPAVQAQTFPKLTGQVVDNAAILSAPQAQALSAKLAALEQQSGRQLVVATIPDLQGYDIADYGYRLGREWGIGDKAANDGALLIVAPKERKIRIEVGYGMEGLLTDAQSAQIIRDVIAPRFKAGDMPGGINAGVDEIAPIMMLPPEEAARRAAASNAKQRQGANSGGGIMTIFWVVVMVGVFIALASGRSRGRKGKRYRGGPGVPIILWGPTDSGWGSGGGSSWGGGGFGSGGGFSGGGGSFGGGGASGDW